MKKIKKIISTGLMTLLILCTVLSPAYGFLITVKGDSADTESEMPHGYIDNGLRFPSIYDESNESGLLQKSSIPESYDSRIYGYVSSVKNQGSLGICWAYAATAAMESYAITHGYADNSIDLSEYALAYMTFKDELYYDSTGDKTTVVNMYQNLKNGGNDYYVFKTLNKWGGMVDEDYERFSFNSFNTTNDTITSGEISADEISYILTGQKFISMRDEEQVKKAIIDNGAVSSYYYDNSQYYSSGYTGAKYYNYEIKSSNHAIAIVGWDDTFPKESFTVDGNTPSRDGAWLIKNSWGQYMLDNGYMWISYDDVSIRNSHAAVYEVAPANKYNYNYQHDGQTMYSIAIGGFSLPFSTTKYANVFEVSGSESQELNAVSFALGETNKYFNIYIYKNPTVDEPESGTLVSYTTGNTTYPGYYTVALPETVSFENGDSFSVVVEFSTNTALEVGRSLYYVGASSDGKQSAQVTNTVSDNQSYVYDAANDKFVDTYDYKNTDLNKNVNICIKAFTTVTDPDSLREPQFISAKQKSINSFEFSWQAVSGATSYDIYRSNDASTFMCIKQDCSEVQFIDTTVEFGKTYYYKVVAKNDKSSVSSNVLKKVIDVPETTIINIEETDSGVLISWNSVLDVDGYYLYRSSGNNPFERVATVSGTSYTDLIDKYYIENRYKIAPYVTIGNKIFEAIGSETQSYTKELSTTVVNSFEWQQGNKLLIKWDSVEGATGYNIYRMLSSDYLDAQLTSTSDNTYIDDISDIDINTTIYYRIEPYITEDGEIKNGSAKEYRGFVKHDNPVENIKWSVDSNGRVVLTWNPYTETTVSKYKIYIGNSFLQTNSNDNKYSTFFFDYTNNYEIGITAANAYNVDYTHIQNPRIKIGGITGTFSNPDVKIFEKIYTKQNETVKLVAELNNEIENYDYTYQWYESNTSDGNGTKIDGATQKEYMPSTKDLGTKYYYVIVSAPFMGTTYTSDSVNNRAEVVTGTGEQLKKGLYKSEDGNWYYYENGVVNADKNGIVVNDAGYWFVENGKINFNKNGVVEDNGVEYVVKYGYMSTGYYGLTKKTDGTWAYAEAGVLTYQYTGLAKNDVGWWYVTDGVIDFLYTGIGTNQTGSYRVVNGQLDFSYNGWFRADDGTWYYIRGGMVDINKNGLQLLNDKYYYLTEGQINFNYTGLAENAGVTYYVKYGYLDFSFSGEVTVNGKKYLVEKGIVQ